MTPTMKIRRDKWKSSIRLTHLIKAVIITFRRLLGSNPSKPSGTKAVIITFRDKGQVDYAHVTTLLGSKNNTR
jgi:hypothetical protein